jgi:hypothetical protein
VDASVKAFRREIQRRLNVSYFAWVGLVVAVLAFIWPVLYGEYAKSREVEAQQSIEIRDLRERLQAQGKMIETIAARQQTLSPLPTPPTAARRARQ